MAPCSSGNRLKLFDCDLRCSYGAFYHRPKLRRFRSGPVPTGRMAVRSIRSGCPYEQIGKTRRRGSFGLDWRSARTPVNRATQRRGETRARQAHHDANKGVEEKLATKKQTYRSRRASPGSPVNRHWRASCEAHRASNHPQIPRTRRIRKSKSSSVHPSLVVLAISSVPKAPLLVISGTEQADLQPNSTNRRYCGDV